MRFIQRGANKNEIVSNNSTEVVEKVNKSNNSGNNSSVVVNGETEKDISDWSKFSGEDNIDFAEGHLNTKFTVTDIKNYVKIINSESDLRVKTIVRGSLSGFVGTYELELPYSKGNQLSVGNSFNVGVQVGVYKDKKVIGDIKY